MKGIMLKRTLIYILTICIAVLGNIVFINGITGDETGNVADIYEIHLSLKSEKRISTPIQLFFSDTDEFNEAGSLTVLYEKYGEVQEINYQINPTCNFLRIDFGSQENTFDVSELIFQSGKLKVDLINEIEQDGVSWNMLTLDTLDAGMRIFVVGDDPYMMFDMEKTGLKKIMHDKMTEGVLQKKILICAVWNLLFLIFWMKRKKIAKIFEGVFSDKGLLLDLAKNDFKTKFAGSYLGITWAFIQPIVTILVYWFVFQVGFKSGTVKDVPFVLWLTAGLVPWFFLNDALNSATASLLEYSYLVKKVVFNVEIIPLVRIVSSFFVHVFFVAFMLVMFMINGIMPKIEWLQIIYYSICLFALIVGVSYLTSALVVFFRDLAQIIIIILQIGMWITPIMWQWSIMPAKVLVFLKLNPVYYIVEGYRNSLIYGRTFWNDTYMTVYFWVFVLLSIVLGTKVFAKLKIHFADML